MKTDQRIRNTAGILLWFALLTIHQIDCRAGFVGKIQGGNVKKSVGNIQGGDAWKKEFDNPTTVRVQFQGLVNALGRAGVSLGGVGAAATNNVDQACGYTWLSTEVGYAQLRPYQTYGIYLWGTNVYGARSEERRVGKECRSRWSPYH